MTTTPKRNGWVGPVMAASGVDVDRLHEVLLTDAGRAALARVEKAGRAHDDETCAGLDREERAQLRELLLRIAGRRGLTPGVHPGYREPPNSGP